MSIARNTLISLASSGAQIATTLIVVPFYLPTIGLERFGVLALVWAILGYFAFTSFGTGPAAAHRIAATGNGDPSERQRVFWTALWTSLGLGAIGAAVCALAAWGASGIIAFGDESLRAEFVAAIPLISVLMLLIAVRSVLTGALQGRERFVSLAAVTTVGAVLSALLPLLVALSISVEIPWLLSAVVIAHLASVMLALGLCWSAVPLGGPARGDRQLVPSLLKFGGWVTVSGVIGPLMVTLDRFLIGSTLGTAAVAYYAVPNDLLRRLLILPASLTSALFPRLSALNERDACIELAERALSWLAFLITPIVLVALVVVEPFLIVWLGHEFAAQAAGVAHIFLIGIWANALARVPAVVLQGTGRPDLMAKAHVAEVVPYLAALFIGLTLFGLPGAAFAWTIRCTADAVILGWLAGFDGRHSTHLTVPGLLIISAAIVSLANPIDATGRWLLLAGIAAALAFWGARHIPPGFAEQISRVRSIVPA